MLIVSYSLDRKAVRERQRFAGDALPDMTVMTKISCGDDAEVTFKDGCLRIKGIDVDIYSELVSYVSTTFVKS